jgi:phage terminase large subunit-like protein
VKRRWVKPKPDDFPGSTSPLPFEVWTPNPTPEQPAPNSRVFVPATLADNPILTDRDPEYINRLRTLAGTDKALLKAWEDGDWDAIDAVEGALWKQSNLDGGRVTKEWFRLNVVPQRRVLAIDPSDGNEDGHGDEYGVAVVCLGMDGVGYVEFTDGWRASPKMMAKKSIQLARDMDCDEIVVEKNNGGKWVKTVLQGEDKYAVIRTVWASEGKITRARPVSGLFELDEELAEEGMPYRMRMVGTAHEDFEDEATTFTGAPGEVSPNRLDAVVWAGTATMLKPRMVHDGDKYEDKRLSNRR